MLETKDMFEEYMLYTLMIAIITPYKLLDYKVEEKQGPRISEDASGENQFGKNKKKDKGKVKPFGKSNEDKTKEPEAPKEKGEPISC
jgi:hypothetical protein